MHYAVSERDLCTNLQLSRLHCHFWGVLHVAEEGGAAIHHNFQFAHHRQNQFALADSLRFQGVWGGLSQSIQTLLCHQTQTHNAFNMQSRHFLKEERTWIILITYRGIQHEYHLQMFFLSWTKFQQRATFSAWAAPPAAVRTEPSVFVSALLWVGLSWKKLMPHMSLHQIIIQQHQIKILWQLCGCCLVPKGHGRSNQIKSHRRQRYIKKLSIQGLSKGPEIITNEWVLTASTSVGSYHTLI